MILKLFGRYRSAYYPRAIQASVAFMRYLTILCLISIVFDQGCSFAAEDSGNAILAGAIATIFLIPFCMLLRAFVMHCAFCKEKKEWSVSMLACAIGFIFVCSGSAIAQIVLIEWNNNYNGSQLLASAFWAALVFDQFVVQMIAVIIQWCLSTVIQPKGFLSQLIMHCLLYTSPSPRDLSTSRMPSSA
eukprot:TRINITY_DN3318_c0_g1_i1.p2 TRINITY_DN3318_c0_g1~~TRINITY_DN3318_c0_g1_i1.p2  ORF type:complete len:188 (+),score=43.44 TRINITY_DN3318_c0_g1_i1:847-1410(+)